MKSEHIVDHTNKQSKKLSMLKLSIKRTQHDIKHNKLINMVIIDPIMVR